MPGPIVPMASSPAVGESSGTPLSCAAVASVTVGSLTRPPISTADPSAACAKAPATRALAALGVRRREADGQTLAQRRARIGSETECGFEQNRLGRPELRQGPPQHVEQLAQRTMLSPAPQRLVTLAALGCGGERI